ncbi:protein PYRICULARIA ORYZAE RESISTANCE 21-like isoform X2 [Musa acuminata AAA Group]|uniref:protein PYRICULARIA ORYZAE RESISTANCE 21-like isoform X2 n=1 Tax=Musa acuminata AAA Group TaxID=214697 RepID=UPI0031D7F9C4
MAEIATVLITVDLHCCTCSKKIKKALCKLQNRFNIESIVYDQKKNTITVSGPFNPDCFIKKIRCLACKVIICVQIKQKQKPVTPPPPPPPPPPPKVDVNLGVCVYPGWPNCWVYDGVCDGLPPPAFCRPCRDGYNIIVEQEPCQSCSIM